MKLYKTKKLVIVSMALLLSACASSNDPFNIGTFPSLPGKNVEVGAIPGPHREVIDHGRVHVKDGEVVTVARGQIPDHPSDDLLTARASNGVDPGPLDKAVTAVGSTRVQITSAWGVGAQVTIWALAENNWLWGYSPLDLADFDEAFFWYAAWQKDGSVVFASTSKRGSGGGNTCMDPYNSGVVHHTCGRDGNVVDGQRWNLIPASNGTMLIVNTSNQKCLRLPGTRNGWGWNLTIEPCDFSPGAKIDKTFLWNLTPWSTSSNPTVVTPGIK